MKYDHLIAKAVLGHREMLKHGKCEVSIGELYDLCYRVDNEPLADNIDEGRACADKIRRMMEC